jgi:stage V sporulation protein B
MKSKIIKSTFILLIGGLFTKILGMFIKIVMTRILGTEGIGTYMLIIPTFSLLIALAQLGFPVAISKLVAEETKNNKNLVFATIPISLIINIFIIFILIFSSSFLSNNLLHESNTRYGLMCIGFVLPFISISSILRGYFFGKQKMFPHVISNIVEDVIRLIIIFLGVPIFLLKGLDYAIAFIVLSNIISELTSIFILLFFLPKNFKIEKQDLIPNKNNLIDIFSISIPTTISRLIGNIGYFFEPIILTNILLYLNYSNSFITTEYGIINGYVLPLLLLPSFFTMAISQALIPVISKSYVTRDMDNVRRKIKQAIVFSLIVGIPITILLTVYPAFFLKLIYNTTEGVNYLKILAPIFILLYIQSPLSASLQAMGKAKIGMYGTFIGILIKTTTLVIFTFLNIGMWGLILSAIFGIIFVTFYDLYNIKKLA